MSLLDGIKIFWLFLVVFPLLLGICSVSIKFLTRGRNTPALFATFQYNIWSWIKDGGKPAFEYDMFSSVFSLVVFNGIGGGLLVCASKYVITEGFPLMTLIPLCVIIVALFIRFLLDVQHNLSINKIGDSDRIKHIEAELKQLKEKV